MNEYVIETEALCKRYGRKLAVDHLDLRVPRGNIHAIVGANGAGKSTLFRILLGFLSPSSGHARILGCESDRQTPELRGRIGFVNEEHSLPRWMRVHAVVNLQTLHKDISLLVDPDAGHVNDNDVARQAMGYLILRMLHRHLGGDAPSSPDARLRAYIGSNLRIDGPGLGYR